MQENHLEQDTDVILLMINLVQDIGLAKTGKQQEKTMPMVNGKKYAYTKKGKAAAKKAKMQKKKRGKK